LLLYLNLKHFLGVIVHIHHGLSYHQNSNCILKMYILIPYFSVMNLISVNELIIIIQMFLSSVCVRFVSSIYLVSLCNWSLGYESARK
jgi:hypothetical protein